MFYTMTLFFKQQQRKIFKNQRKTQFMNHSAKNIQVKG